MLAGLFFAGGFVYMAFDIDFLGYWIIIIYLFALFGLWLGVKNISIAFMKYCVDQKSISLKNLGKVIKETKYSDVREVYKYSIYTFGAINQSKAFYRNGKKNLEKELPIEAPVFCLSEFDLAGYEDRDVFIHLGVLSQFALNFRLLYPSELYYFTVLYLIPAMEKPLSPTSLISQIVHEKDIYERLVRLREKYKTVDKLSSKAYSVFGFLPMKNAVKEECELYKAIAKLPVMQKILVVADDGLEEDRIVKHIPERVMRISWAKEKKVRCIYESTPGIRNIDLCFMQRVSEYNHIENSLFNSTSDNVRISWETLSAKNIYAPKRAYISYGALILISVITGHLLSLLFGGYELEFPLLVAVFLWLGTICNAPMLASYSFCRECVCCMVPAMYLGETRGSNRGVRSWRPCNSAFREYLYMYSYSSLVECGYFEKDGTEYIYASKKHLSDEELEEFRSRFVLCDENTFAMVFDGGVRSAIERIPGIRRSGRG